MVHIPTGFGVATIVIRELS